MRTFSIVTLLFALLALPATALADATAEPSAVLSEDDGLDGKLNVNDATAEQWALLPGIGPSMAKRLVEYRAKQKFTAVNQVMRIKGVGKKTFAEIKPYLTLEGQTTLQETAKPAKKSEPKEDPAD